MAGRTGWWVAALTLGLAAQGCVQFERDDDDWSDDDATGDDDAADDDDSVGDDDTADDDDTGDDDTGDDDTGHPGTYDLDVGEYELTIDAAALNTCENEQGHGIHVHVGESTAMYLTESGDTVTGDVDGLPLSGPRTDDTLALGGQMVMQVGAQQGLDCALLVVATLDAVITADHTFDYTVAAEFTEQGGADCDEIVGDDGIIPALPCNQQWNGVGTRIGPLPN